MNDMNKKSRSFLTEEHKRKCKMCGSIFMYPRNAYIRTEKSKEKDEEGKHRKLTADSCLFCYNGNKITGSHHSLFGITRFVYGEMLKGQHKQDDLLSSTIAICYSSGVRNAMRTGARGEYTNQMRFENAPWGYKKYDVRDHINSMSVQAFYWVVLSLYDMFEVEYEKMSWDDAKQYEEGRKAPFTEFFESMGIQMYVTSSQNKLLAKTVQLNGTTAIEYVNVMGRGEKQRGGYYTKQETINLIKDDCIGDVYGTIDVIKKRFLTLYKKIKETRRNVSGEESTKKGIHKEYLTKEVKSI